MEGRPLYEPVPVPDIYVSGIARFELVGRGDVRCVLYVDQVPLDGGAAERIVAVRLIGSLDNLPSVVRQLLAVMAENGITMSQDATGKRLS